MAPPPTIEQAAQAFVYGYPLVYDTNEVARFVAGHAAFPFSAPYNQFGSARELLGPETKFASPNNDTLYVLAMCDVRESALVLHVPDTADRYYVLQFVDAWTNNFAYIGRRATGTGEGRFLLVGPGWNGEPPNDIDQVVRAPTAVFSIVGRVQVDGEHDAPAVHGLQDQFTLTPLDTRVAPTGVPTSDARVGDALAWWEKLRVRLAAFPPPASDAPFLAIGEQLGLTAATSPYVEPDPDLAALLVAGEKGGRETIEKLVAGGGGGKLTRGWTDGAHFFDYNGDFFEVGTIDTPEWKIADRTVAYATRAVAARAGLWGNHGYEAEYFLTFVDADGNPLSGDHSYELRLPSAPPVDAFWSLTMYDVPDFYLVANPINRYSIGDRTPGVVTAADGSITIVMQSESPGPERESNWLPTPTGRFRPILRMYQPRPEVLSGEYAVPAIERVS